MIHPTTATVITPRLDTQTDIDETIYEPVVAGRTTGWGAIVAGAFVALALMAIFAVLGTAIGLTVVGATNDTPEEGLSIGAGIYWLISGLLALFVGGFVASYLRRTADSGTGAIHGFLAWCTVTVLSSVLLAMTGGAAVGGSLAAVGDAMQARTTNSARITDRDRVNVDGNTVTKEEAKDAAQKAAVASWWTFIALVMGAGISAIGGITAARKCDYDRTHNGTRRTTVHRSS